MKSNKKYLNELIRADERAKTLKEILGWIDAKEMLKDAEAYGSQCGACFALYDYLKKEMEAVNDLEHKLK